MSDANKWWLWMRNSGYGGSAPWITLEIHRVNALMDCEFEEMFGTSVGAFHYWQEGTSTKYFRTTDLEVFDTNFIERLDRDPTVINEWLQEAYRRGQSLVESADALGESKLESLADQELLRIFKNTTDKYWKLGVHSSIPLFGGRTLQNILEPYLTDLMTSRGEDLNNFGSYYAALTGSNYLSWSKKEEQLLRQLALEIKHAGLDTSNLPPEYERRLVQHARSFEWIPYKWIGPTWSLKDFRQRLDIMIDAEERVSASNVQEQEVISRLKIDDQYQIYFSALARLGDLKEMKCNYMSRAAYQLGKFRNEIQRRFGLAERQTALMLSCDYLKLLSRGDIDGEEISARQKAFLWVAEDGKDVTYTNQAALDSIKTEFTWQEVIKDRKSYTGTPVFPGKVVGLARKILRYEKDKDKFKEGDVLIAYRTTPHYVPIMDISNAVITTEGGLTQHAAQIAREHKIPCIVGVTDIIDGLEDGQPLLVDSNRGVIEKIAQDAYENMRSQKERKYNIHIAKTDLRKADGAEIIWLEEASNKEPDRNLTGNKAANQAICYRMFNVPNGFITTTAMYYHFIQESGLIDKLKELPDKLRKAGLSLEELEKISREYIGRIVNTDISGFFDGVGHAYNVLDVLSTVTRSSAIAEDVQSTGTYQGTSFAGIFETFLDHRNADQAIDGIKKCWASMFSPRALLYGVRSGFDMSCNQMGVLVQEMKNGTTSGVIYTGVDGYTLIEACEGLCDPLVSGKITPSMYILDRDLNLVFTQPGNQKLKEYIDSKGVYKEGYAKNQLPLQEKDLFELGMISRKIQNYFGAPQDIEWTTTDLIYVTQNRDLTSKPTLPNGVKK